MDAIIEPLRVLSHWFLGFAESDYVVWVLAISSFIESIFFPIPPDPLLIAASIINPKSALVLAAIVTVASVGGAVVGHWLGQRYGRPLLRRFVSDKKFDKVELMFQRYGTWAVLVAAFTPIPYKVFAISAGILELNLRSFIVASLIGRGARFFLIGGLIFFFGAPIQEFIESRLEIVTIVASVALLAALLVVWLVARLRRDKKALASNSDLP
jgi:undecaprenyl-diphosphatase